MTATEIPVDNGFNVQALLGVRGALAGTRQISQFQWRSTVSWVNGTYSRSDVETCYGFGAEQGTTGGSATTSTTRCSSPRRTTASRRWNMCWSPWVAAGRHQRSA